MNRKIISLFFLLSAAAAAQTTTTVTGTITDANGAEDMMSAADGWQSTATARAVLVVP